MRLAHVPRQTLLRHVWLRKEVAGSARALALLCAGPLVGRKHAAALVSAASVRWPGQVQVVSQHEGAASRAARRPALTAQSVELLHELLAALLQGVEVP